MIMKKSKLTFEKALELLSSWNPVCYSELSNRICIFEVPMLSSFDIMRLSRFCGWYVSCGSYVVDVVLTNK